MIEISHLHKFFNKGKHNEIHVINDVTISLPETGIVAIFGRSGCGKTTLLNVIGGLDSYRSGSVTVMGESIASHPDSVRNRDMGYIFQNYNLLKNETCFDNVAYALRLAGLNNPDEIRQRVDTALSFVDMAQYARRTPDTLSGGQQQRIAIARAIVKNPRIILADEPTGNLDEANTVMVMDLLREIARDCLVLLVTHEADLVDYYCDTVIELADGRVADIRHNSITDGYAVRDKNTVYLGELEKETVENTAVSVSYYGAKPTVPIAIKVVNYGGKTYLAVDTPGVQMLDRDSEMKLNEGVFERRESQKQKERHVDMSRLPRVKGGVLGRLYSFRSAVASGYRANFGKQKRGKRMLRSCLALFAAVIVFMTAIFGTSIGRIEKLRSAYNQNVFYVRTDDPATSLELHDPDVWRKYGIDSVGLQRNYTARDETLLFGTGFFETFESSSYDFMTHGVFLPAGLTKSMTLLAGKKTVAEGEILLSSASADLLLEASTLSYLKDYEDLVGLSTAGGMYRSPYKIVGIVQSDETAFYLSDKELAERAYLDRNLQLMSAADMNVTLGEDEVIFVSRYYDPMLEDAYKVGGTMKIVGEDFTVKEIRSSLSYEGYLESMGIKVLSYDEHVENELATRYPDLVKESEEYYQKHSELYETGYAAYLLGYYSHLEAFCRSQTVFNTDFESWLYLEKGIPDLYYRSIRQELYLVHAYQKEFGKLPGMKEIWEYESSDEPDRYYKEYEPEYIASVDRTYYDTMVILPDDAYIRLSSRLGKSESAVDPYSDMDDYGDYLSVIHTSSPELLEAYLLDRYDDPNSSEFSVITPNRLFEEDFTEERITVIAGCITMGVILVIMSICMYFIMRSALMNRIREVGILRAIGVTKKNLVYRFAVETLVLTALTVLVGYLLSSGFIGLCYSASSLMSEIFYYPLWLAGSVLLVLFLLSMFCGLVPISRLLKKTPSEIIAKYDI